MSTEAPVGGDSIIRDRYQLQSLLGHGGMGMVWSAHDRRLDRTVALKLLRPDVPESTALQMEREARAAARVDDQRVVNVLDLDHMEDGRPFLVLELHEGWTLADELRAGPLEPDRFRMLTEDLLGGLAAAHERNVLHRDIKPANVLAEIDGFRITDFGLASIDTDRQSEPSLMGTLAYIAPERLHGTPGTYAADVFSAAVVLYEAASGNKPFVADTPAEAVMAVRSRRIAPLPEHVPAPLRDTILLALDPDPDHRPADAGRMLAAARGSSEARNPTLIVPSGGENTRPIDPLDDDPPGAATTTDMPAPRSGLTRSLPAPVDGDDPTAPGKKRRPAAWRRRPDLLVAVAVALTLMFVLGTTVSDGSTDPVGTSDTPPTTTATSSGDTGGSTGADQAGTAPGQGQGKGQAQDPNQRLQDTLTQIEELGR